MLARLNHSKKLLLLILFFGNSCGKPQVFYHTELNCPTRGIILIRYASEQDVRASIVDFYNRKKANHSAENYTVITLPGKRSFKIEKASVEEIMECGMRQVPAPKPHKKFLKNILTPSYEFVSW